MSVDVCLNLRLSAIAHSFDDLSFSFYPHIDVHLLQESIGLLLMKVLDNIHYIENEVLYELAGHHI